jgi:hypothetical protein
MELPVDYDKLKRHERKPVREEYIRIQNGLCSHCHISLEQESTYERTVIINKSLFPKGFFNSPIHLHHNHSSGMTIGAVHAYCNAYMWEFLGE